MQKRVLIIKPSSLGDIVHGLQALVALKAQGCPVHVTWVVNTAFADLVRYASCVDEVWTFDRQGGFAAYKAVCQQVRTQTFDYVLDMQGLARSAFWTFLARAHIKAGRRDNREGAWLAYDIEAPYPVEGREHALDILLQFAEVFGYRGRLVGQLAFNLPDDVAVQSSLKAWTRPPVWLLPESRRAEKEWPYFEALAKALRSALPPEVPLVVLGSRQVPPYVPDHPGYHHWVGQTRLTDLIACMQHSGLSVCNDSGPMHLAAALGQPVVALFGPTSPARFGPYPYPSPLHQVLQAPGGRLEALGVEQVTNAVLAHYARCFPS
jgi:ADP-heptose:LPS heptosyltransferase